MLIQSPIEIKTEFRKVVVISVAVRLEQNAKSQTLYLNGLMGTSLLAKLAKAYINRIDAHAISFFHQLTA